MASNNNSNPFPLRIKLKSGQPILLENLTTDTTIGDLKAILSGITGYNWSQLRILSGFPPKPVNLNLDDMETISTLSLRPKDLIIIDVASNEIIDNQKSGSGAKSSHPKSLPTDNNERPIDAPVFGSSVNPVVNIPDAKLPEGILIRKVVPSDNSCLFTSVYFCLSSGELNAKKGVALRQIIAETVAGDEMLYTEGFLGRPNREYCTWILNHEHWGGAIELSILSRYYQIEIDAVDTQNVRINRFGEDQNYSTRILLIYDGIHYDPLIMELFDANQSIKTIFPTTDESILTSVLEIAKESKASRLYTDVQNFTLKCGICHKKLTGQIEAQTHAKETGHTSFSEM